MAAQVAINSKVTFGQIWLDKGYAADSSKTGVDASGRYDAALDKSIALLAGIHENNTLMTALKSLAVVTPAPISTTPVNTDVVINPPVDNTASQTSGSTSSDTSAVVTNPSSSSSAGSTTTNTGQNGLTGAGSTMNQKTCFDIKKQSVSQIEIPQTGTSTKNFIIKINIMESKPIRKNTKTL